MKTLRLVREIKRTKRPRLYAYRPYIELLSERAAGETEDGPSVPTQSDLIDGAAAVAGGGIESKPVQQAPGKGKRRSRMPATRK
jgi:hypothetical protein